MAKVETKKQAPWCPKCKSEGPFKVGITQRNFYVWDGQEWMPTGDEPEYYPQAYDVTCDNCMWNWQEEPWN